MVRCSKNRNVRLNSEGNLVDMAVPTFSSFTKQAITGDVADAQIDEAYFKC